MGACIHTCLAILVCTVLYMWDAVHVCACVCAYMHVCACVYIRTVCTYEYTMGQVWLSEVGMCSRTITSSVCLVSMSYMVTCTASVLLVCEFVCV